MCLKSLSLRMSFIYSIIISVPRSVQMRLYSLNKRQFVMVFVTFLFMCVLVNVLVGTAGMNHVLISNAFKFCYSFFRKKNMDKFLMVDANWLKKYLETLVIVPGITFGRIINPFTCKASSPSVFQNFSPPRNYVNMGL